MQFGEFNQQLDRLKRQFGDKAFSDEKSKLLWRRFAFVDSRAFEQVVDHLIMNHKTSPVGDDFFEALDGTRNKYAPSGDRCTSCDNSGWNEIWRHPSGQIIAERCTCRGGPEALARSIEKHPTAPDGDLAKRIRECFSPTGRTYMTKITRPELVNPS